MTVRRAWLVVSVVLVLVAVSCAPAPEPQLPDPVITCASVGGDVLADPPASPGLDVTAEFQSNWALSGCTDHTGGGVTGGTFEATSLLIPDIECFPPSGTVWGTGSGQIRWSNRGASQFDARLVYTGTNNDLGILELEITGGMWTGARASFVLRPTAAEGNCFDTPLTSLTLVNRAPVVVRGPLPPPMTEVAEVATGATNTCARIEAGSVRCWGANVYGQLGDGAVLPGSPRDLPVDVVGITEATQVTVGEYHSCALIEGGSVRCWGSGGRGELGNGEWLSSSTPVQVSGITDAVAIAQGAAHTCALRAAGTVECWGYNNYGSLGNGTSGNYADSNLPVEVLGLVDVEAIAAGGSTTCALIEDGTVRCWGQNSSGILGDGTIGPDATTPVTVVGLTDVTALSLGSHACALLGDGTLRCWGANDSGQLGDGSMTLRATPVQVLGIADAVSVEAGSGHTCAIRSGGSVDCWGANTFGQLGDGTTSPRTNPSAVLGIDDATSLGATAHTCAVRAGGSLECWGLNSSGQLGIGSTTNRYLPVPVRS